MNLEMMAPVMFGSLIVFLLIGYPVAFALGAVGLLFSWIGIHFDLLRPSCCKPCRARCSTS